jgi:hypothetical protein
MNETYTSVQSARAPLRTRRSLPGGVVLMGIGTVLVVSNLNAQLADRVWGLLLMLPLAVFAVHGALMYCQSGQLRSGLLWAMFGCSFLALAGLGMLTGQDFDAVFPWITPAAFLLIGAASLLRRR